MTEQQHPPDLGPAALADLVAGRAPGPADPFNDGVTAIVAEAERAEHLRDLTHEERPSHYRSKAERSAARQPNTEADTEPDPVDVRTLRPGTGRGDDAAVVRDPETLAEAVHRGRVW